MTRRLPAGFLIGCATAAHQVEGGIDNDWAAWERRSPSPIAGGGDTSRAIDHYRRFREDIAQLAAAGHNAYRFSIEWARIEPRPGVFDAAAFAHYADVVRTCRDHGLEPIVTLHHFTLPRWLAEHGGVRSAEAPMLFARYAAACAWRLGQAVTWWLTLNEPSVLVVQGFLNASWPPQRRSLGAAFDAARGLLRMHAAGARALHEVASRRGHDARVSFAHHERRLRPKHATSPLDRAATVLPNYVFNRWFLQACITGRVLPPIGHGERVPGLYASLDYLGVNYYTEDTVRFDPRAPMTFFAAVEADADLPLSSFGWAINPHGLRRALTSLWRLTALPLLVTENGVADEHDELRPAYIVDHLNALLDAVDDGVDMRGYLHWTAWDNFEWAEGYTKRFGLWEVDRQTMERRPKPSAALYSSICASRSVPATP